MAPHLELRTFLLNEEKEYFGRKIGTLLTAAQELAGEAPQMGPRHLTRLALTLVNQIRQVLHNEWSVRQRAHLEVLQRLGVAVMKGIDEKGDLAQILQSGVAELQQMMQDLGVPQNALASDKIA